MGKERVANPLAHHTSKLISVVKSFISQVMRKNKHFIYVSIGEVSQQKRSWLQTAIAPLLLALASLVSVTQIG